MYVVKGFSRSIYALISRIIITFLFFCIVILFTKKPKKQLAGERVRERERKKVIREKKENRILRSVIKWDDLFIRLFNCKKEN